MPSLLFTLKPLIHLQPLLERPAGLRSQEQGSRGTDPADDTQSGLDLDRAVTEDAVLTFS